MVVGLYIAYMPTVVFVTTIAENIHMGPLQTLWASLAPTMGLEFMVCFLPTFIITIFKTFFTLHDDAWSQYKLQNWYFCFQVVFVLLVTAVGSSVLTFMRMLVVDPMGVPGLLGQKMPKV